MNKKLLALVLVLSIAFYIKVASAYKYNSMDECLNASGETLEACCNKLSKNELKKDDDYTDINQELCSYECSQCKQ